MQKGRSMVEMLGVLILIAVLTVSVLSVWTQIRTKMQITQSQNEIFQIAQNTSSLYSWTRDYALLDGSSGNMEELCKNDVFPAGCHDGKALNPFGGEYQVKRAQAQNDDSDRYSYFTITITGLPSEGACDEILGYDFENAVSMDCLGSEDNVDATITFQ